MTAPLPAVLNKPGVVLLPASSPAREQVATVLEESGGLLLPGLVTSEAEVVIVDITQPEGLAELTKVSARSVALVVLLDWSKPEQVSAAVASGATGLAAFDAGACELRARIDQSRLRHASDLEAARRQKDLRLLLELTADYAASLDVAQLLHTMTRRLAEEMDILRASLIVVDEQQNAGVVVAASDDSSLRDHRLDLQRYPEIREVLRTGGPVIVEDAPSHPLLEGVQGEVAARGIHAIAALPLTLQGKVLGVLLLRAGAGREGFHPREIDFLATVAHATAVALRNARLVETIRGQTEAEKSARLAAEERAAQLETYEGYFAHVSDAVLLVDQNACVLSINPAGERLFEVSLADAKGQHLHSVTRPHDETLLMNVLVAVRRGEVRREVDVPVGTHGGRKLILSLAAARLDEAGAAILSFRDVTLQRQLADELRSTKEFLERLIDSSVDAIIAADMRGKIILFNKGAEAICGWTAAEAMQSLNVRQLYPNGGAKKVMERLRSTELGGKGRLSATREEIVTRSGERVPVNMTAAILYEGEREVASVGIFTDLRDRMQLERKLSDAEIRLEESERNAVIVALAGTAAHELNQPLTSVMGYAELLKRKLKTEDAALRPVEIIYREAERMAEIVRKIGKITRYETKAYVGSSKILDLEKATSHEE